MARGYGLSEPPEHTDTNSWPFKRWFDELMELMVSQITIVTVTAAYTVARSVFYVRGDATAAAFAVTLPAALNMQGRQIAVKKIDASGNAVTVTAAGSDTIDGSATSSLAAQWNKVHLISNGVDTWEVL